MGCIARLGCLFSSRFSRVGGWFTRDRWLPEQYRSHAAVDDERSGLGTAERRRRRSARERRSTKLSQPRGPVFQTLSGADVASYVFARARRDAARVGATASRRRSSGDRVSMRANVKLSDLGGASALGPLGGMLGDREPVQLTGTFRVVKPGVAEFQVQDVEDSERSTVPRGMIPTLDQRDSIAARGPPGVDARRARRCRFPRTWATFEWRTERSPCTRPCNDDGAPHPHHRRRAGHSRGARPAARVRGLRGARGRQRRRRHRRVSEAAARPRVPRREDGGHRRRRGAEEDQGARSERDRRDDQRPRDDPDRGRSDAARRVRHSREAARHRSHSRHAAQRAAASRSARGERAAAARRSSRATRSSASRTAFAR